MTSTVIASDYKSLSLLDLSIRLMAQFILLTKCMSRSFSLTITVVLLTSQPAITSNNHLTTQQLITSLFFNYLHFVFLRPSDVKLLHHKNCQSLCVTLAINLRLLKFSLVYAFTRTVSTV